VKNREAGTRDASLLRENACIIFKVSFDVTDSPFISRIRAYLYTFYQGATV